MKQTHATDPLLPSIIGVFQMAFPVVDWGCERQQFSHQFGATVSGVSPPDLNPYTRCNQHLPIQHFVATVTRPVWHLFEHRTPPPVDRIDTTNLSRLQPAFSQHVDIGWLGKCICGDRPCCVRICLVDYMPMAPLYDWLSSGYPVAIQWLFTGHRLTIYTGSHPTNNTTGDWQCHHHRHGAITSVRWRHSG